MQQTLGKLIFFGFVALGIFFLPTVRAAGTEVFLSGQTWSSNIGWMDFHPVFGGVKYDTASGNLSGYAWSSNLGWISFEDSDVSNCPSGSCRAKIIQDDDAPSDPTKGMVTGWARVVSACAADRWNGSNCTGNGDAGNLAGGWDGWVSFNCDNNSGCGTSNYKTKINHTSGDFSGYAWGSDVLGWISFNCANPGENCTQSNYKVTKTPEVAPTVDLTAIPPSVNQDGSSTLSWTSTDATTCDATGDWSGNKSTSGSSGTGVLNSPPSSRSYTLTCTGSGGSSFDTVTVSILYDFGVTVTPSNTQVTFISGASASTTPVEVTLFPLGGFAESIALTIPSIVNDNDGSPVAGYTYNMNPSSLSSPYSSGSTLIITFPGTTPAGSYTATIQGAGGGLVRTASLRINGGGVTPEVRER